jgi:lipopolysaccharide export system permease protein
MTLIDRYIIRAVLGFTGLVMAVLLVLAMLFTFMGEQGDVGQGHYTALNALWFVLLNLPQQAWELMPIGVLIGSLLGLGSLARGSELTVMRSSGISVARLAGAVFIAGLILLAVEVILGQLAPPIEQSAKQQKAFDRFANVSFGGGAAWVRDGNMIINIEQLAGARQFGGMMLFEL